MPKGSDLHLEFCHLSPHILSVSFVLHLSPLFSSPASQGKLPVFFLSSHACICSTNQAISEKGTGIYFLFSIFIGSFKLSYISIILEVFLAGSLHTG